MVKLAKPTKIKKGSNSSQFYTKGETIANFFKAYISENDRYSGAATDKLERIHMRDQSGDRHTACSIIIYNAGHTLYCDVLRVKNLILMELANKIKKRFHTPERTCALLRKWDSLTLTTVIASNTGKPPGECFDLLITRLNDI